MPERLRYENEIKTMQKIQSDKYDRYYCLSNKWVNKWLKYTTTFDKSDALPPGPVDNKDIENLLIAKQD
jgi:hypothetical protein